MNKRIKEGRKVNKEDELDEKRGEERANERS